MEMEISPVMFEWLLADWAGYSDRPEVVFPELGSVDRARLADELANSLSGKLIGQKAQAGQHDC